MVKVKTTTMDLTKCALEIPLLLPLNSQDIHQGTIFGGTQYLEGGNSGVSVKMVEWKQLQVFPVQQVLHRLLNEDYCILGKSEKTGLGRL